jgi:hypothetical protein
MKRLFEKGIPQEFNLTDLALFTGYRIATDIQNGKADKDFIMFITDKVDRQLKKFAKDADLNELCKSRYEDWSDIEKLAEELYPAWKTEFDQWLKNNNLQ